MKKFILQAVILLVIIFTALIISTTNIPDLPFLPQRPESAQVKVGNVIILVEVADSAGQRQKGLGGRQSLASDSGMLFIFPKPSKYTFWMKGLQFPLDFIWIREDTVADIIKNVSPPSPDQKDENLPLYAPNQPVDKVIEVNAGFVDNNNIRVGDKIEIINQ